MRNEAQNQQKKILTLLVFTGVVKRLRTTPKRMENSLGNQLVTRITEEVDFNGKFTYIVITVLIFSGAPHFIDRRNRRQNLFCRR